MNHCKNCGNNIPDDTSTCEEAGFGDGCGKTLGNTSLPYIEQQIEEFRETFSVPTAKDNWTPDTYPHPLGIVNWLTSALLSAMQERDRQVIELLEGMKKQTEHLVPMDNYEHPEYDQALGYNQALSDAIKRIRAEV
jgi:hypothetical protein